MREEKKNAPEDMKFGGRGMSGQFAKWVAPRYQAKKAEYDEMAKREREQPKDTTLLSTKQHHHALFKAIEKSVGLPSLLASFPPPAFL